MLEYTIHADKNDAIYLSRQVQEFLPDEKVSGLVSLAIEDILIYILDINDELDWIDVIVRDSEDSTIISIKNSGMGYNPNADTSIDPDIINMLVNISDNIDYSQILGLNNTIITIKKS